jgi:adenylyltransferase/sulfurtransferase
MTTSWQGALVPELLLEVYRSVEPAWPHEGCGFLFQPAGDPDRWVVLPTINRAEMLHQKDPARYPRGGADWFEPDMKPWFRACREGAVPRVIFHSHPEVGAYFSGGDFESAVMEGDAGALIERNPGVLHLVVSVRQGVADGAALFGWNAAGCTFDELVRFDAAGRPLSRAG